MRPDAKSVSFTFHKNIFSDPNNEKDDDDDTKKKKNTKNCRRKLQNRFVDGGGGGCQRGNDNRCDSSTSSSALSSPINSSNINSNSSSSDRSVLSVLSLNNSRRVLRNGAEKFSKTISQMRTTIGTISQRFRVATKRRQRLEEGPMTPQNCLTPQTRSRRILGRTPTKLYSPFGIETPACVSTDTNGGSGSCKNHQQEKKKTRSKSSPFGHLYSSSKKKCNSNNDDDKNNGFAEEDNKENAMPKAPLRKKKLTKNFRNALENSQNTHGWDIFCETASSTSTMQRLIQK